MAYDIKDTYEHIVDSHTWGIDVSGCGPAQHQAGNLSAYSLTRQCVPTNQRCCNLLKYMAFNSRNAMTPMAEMHSSSACPFTSSHGHCDMCICRVCGLPASVCPSWREHVNSNEHHAGKGHFEDQGMYAFEDAVRQTQELCYSINTSPLLTSEHRNHYGGTESGFVTAAPRQPCLPIAKIKLELLCSDFASQRFVLDDTAPNADEREPVTWQDLVSLLTEDHFLRANLGMEQHGNVAIMDASRPLQDEVLCDYRDTRVEIRNILTEWKRVADALVYYGVSCGGGMASWNEVYFASKDDYSSFSGLRVFVTPGGRVVDQTDLADSLQIVKKCEFTLMACVDVTRTCGIAASNFMLAVMLLSERTWALHNNDTSKSIGDTRLQWWKQVVDGVPVHPHGVDTYNAFLSHHGIVPVGNSQPLNVEQTPIWNTLMPHQKRVVKWSVAKEADCTSMWMDMCIPIYIYGAGAKPLYLFVPGRILLMNLPRSCKGGFLCDEMGLGKTIEAISLIQINGPRRRRDTCSEAASTPRQPRARKRARASAEQDDARSVFARRLNEPPAANSTHDFSVYTTDGRAVPCERWYSMNCARTVDDSTTETGLHDAGTLIVVPKTVISQWKQEINCRFPDADRLHIVEYAGTSRASRARLLHHADIVLTTYDTLRADIAAEARRDHGRPADAEGQTRKRDPVAQAIKYLPLCPLHRCNWNRIIFDEAHSYLSSTKNVTYTACVNLIGSRKWITTGTPYGNKPETLHCMLNVLGIYLPMEHSSASIHISSGYVSFTSAALTFRHSKQEAQAMTAPEDNSHAAPLFCTAPKIDVAVRLRPCDYNNSALGVQDGDELGGLMNECYNVAKEIAGYVRSRANAYFPLGFAHLVLRYLLNLCSPLINVQRARNILSQLREIMHSISTAHNGAGDGVHEEVNLEASNSVDMGQVYTSAGTDERPSCPVCWEEDIEDAVVGECLHVMCKACAVMIARTTRKCPICRQGICMSKLKRVVNPARKQCEPSLPQQAEEDTNTKGHMYNDDTHVQDEAVQEHERQEGTASAHRIHDALETAGFTIDSDCVESAQRSIRTYTTSAEHFKLKALLHMLLLLPPEDKVVVFTPSSQYVSQIHTLLSRIPNLGSICLNSNCTMPAREKILSRFRETSGPRVLLTTLAIGALGITLTSANIAIFMTANENHALVEQAIDRVHRIGQTKPVRSFRLLCDQSMEMWVLNHQCALGSYSHPVLYDDGSQIAGTQLHNTQAAGVRAMLSSTVNRASSIINGIASL